MNYLRIKSIFNLGFLVTSNHRPFKMIIRKKKFLGSYFQMKASYCMQSPIQNDNIDEMVKQVCKGDSELENKLRIIMLEIEVMRQDGRNAPENEYFKLHHWEYILSLPSRSSRIKYLTYLWKLEKKEDNHKIKKEEANQKYLAMKAQREIDAKEVKENNEDNIKYTLSDNSMFLRIYETSMNAGYNQRLMKAIQFGEKLVVDCSYDNYMTGLEARNAAKQLTISFAENRLHKDPFDLHFCNCNKESINIKQLYRNIPTLSEPWFPLHVHTESYLDLFPKENLVYLTPHCRNELTTFDPDAIYIIGCMVDKVNNDPLSLAKAKEQNIKMAKFPLDRYLQWGAGSGKSLTINQVLNIMLDLKLTGDWDYALRHVPRRKIFNENYTNKYSQERVYKPLKSEYTSISNYDNGHKPREFVSPSGNFRRNNEIHSPVNPDFTNSKYFNQKQSRERYRRSDTYSKNDEHSEESCNYIKNDRRVPSDFQKRKKLAINSLFDDTTK